ncbi:OmpA family protein [Salmonirosea aquatica]|uniref:OmpA family protein n=1 Tax=Salmonirosea aquatica TaxID=2654236 RepID=A0A7C9FN44_9BACT|nr:OmpA family protein [Cytophagaceae bacterium SJW1-29]
MKSFKIFALLTTMGFAIAWESQAQIRINRPERVIERQAENRANRRIDQAVDKGFDKLEEGIGSIFKKKDKKEEVKKEEGGNNGNGTAETSESQNGGGRMSGGDANDQAAQGAGSEKAAFKSYSKFDFVPGEKIVASEDFSQDAVGDFPAKWNTNGSAEVVTIEGYEGKWLMFNQTKSASYIPDFIKNLPDNFTLEYDLIYNNLDKEYAYQQWLYTAFYEAEKNDANIQSESGGRGAVFGINGGMGSGSVSLVQTDPNAYRTDLQGNRDMANVINPDNNGKIFHVAMWRQKQRLRIYVDDLKVFDLPRIFPADINLNAMRFHSSLSRENDQMFVSNIRLAVGAPDTRSKLITEGKFVTTGITFDVNSATIRPESYAVLKDIAGTLSENPAVKVKIIGHTDSDGDDATNMALSKKRAESVKENLVTEFGIDKSRLETDGKGETAPAAPNTTPEGKANNRRVEFVKM